MMGGIPLRELERTYPLSFVNWEIKSDENPKVPEGDRVNPSPMFNVEVTTPPMVIVDVVIPPEHVEVVTFPLPSTDRQPDAPARAEKVMVFPFITSP